MGAFQFLLLLFFLIPLSEIYLLLKVGGIVGAFPTIGLVVFTAVLGAFLVRKQGFATLMRVQECVARQEIPAIPMLEAACILVAGALLLTPGFITDTMGFAILVPPWRRAFILWVISRQIQQTHPMQDGNDENPRVIEGEFRREDD